MTVKLPEKHYIENIDERMRMTDAVRRAAALNDAADELESKIGEKERALNDIEWKAFRERQNQIKKDVAAEMADVQAEADRIRAEADAITVPDKAFCAEYDYEPTFCALTGLVLLDSDRVLTCDVTGDRILADAILPRKED